METISNYPKLARVRVVFYVEVVYLILQTIIYITGLIALIVVFNELKARLADEHAASIDYAAIVGILIALVLLYIGEVGLVVFLYQGVRQKNIRKLGIWVVANIAILALLIVLELIEWTERRYLGSAPSIVQLIFITYRCVAVTLVYDSIRELRRFPISVPFVSMSCEDERV